jgi:enamine deaminase RidA (YjgF/YER057c/UK114 family)
MAQRQSVNFPGFAHSNPIPNASQIGNIMMSSVISGPDPGTRNYPAELSGQVANLFKHIRAAVEAAGGTPDNILRITSMSAIRRPDAPRSTTSGSRCSPTPLRAQRGIRLPPPATARRW